MPNTVISLRSSGATGNTPSLGVLANGELSLNFADGILYYKTAANTLGLIRTTQPSGLNQEIQFNDSGSFGGNSALTFDKSTGLLSTNNLTANSVATTSYIQFGDGSKQYTANAGTSGGTVTSVAGASGAVSNTQILSGLLTVDGTGSGLDADLLDGLNSSSFANTTFTQAAFDKANTNLANTGTLVTANSFSQFYFANSQASTSTSTGSVVILGGLGVGGALNATTKSFSIPHPTKDGMTLRYGSLEGPEFGVYIRGRLKNNTIELPDYWIKLIDIDSITVQLTPIGVYQKLYVQEIAIDKITIINDNMFDKAIDCYFIVYAERKDIDKLQVES